MSTPFTLTETVVLRQMAKDLGQTVSGTDTYATALKAILRGLGGTPEPYDTPVITWRKILTAKGGSWNQADKEYNLIYKVCQIINSDRSVSYTRAKLIYSIYNAGGFGGVTPIPPTPPSGGLSGFDKYSFLTPDGTVPELAVSYGSEFTASPTDAAPADITQAAVQAVALGNLTNLLGAAPMMDGIDDWVDLGFKQNIDVDWELTFKFCVGSGALAADFYVMSDFNTASSSEYYIMLQWVTANNAFRIRCKTPTGSTVTSNFPAGGEENKVYEVTITNTASTNTQSATIVGIGNANVAYGTGATNDARANIHVATFAGFGSGYKVMAWDIVYSESSVPVHAYDGTGLATWTDTVGSTDGTVNGSPTAWDLTDYMVLDAGVDTLYNNGTDGIDFVQATDTQQPLIMEDTVLQDGIVFDGVDDVLVAADAGGAGSIASKKAQIAVVAKFPDYPTTKGVIFGKGDATSGGYQITRDDAGQVSIDLYQSGTANLHKQYKLPIATVDGAFHNIVIEIDATDTSDVTATALFDNKSLTLNETVAATGVYGDDASASISIGADPSAANADTMILQGLAFDVNPTTTIDETSALVKTGWSSILTDYVAPTEVLAYVTEVETDGGTVALSTRELLTTFFDSLGSTLISKIDHLWIPLCDDENGIAVFLIHNLGPDRMQQWINPYAGKYTLAGGMDSSWLGGGTLGAGGDPTTLGIDRTDCSLGYFPLTTPPAASSWPHFGANTASYHFYVGGYSVGTNYSYGICQQQRQNYGGPVAAGVVIVNRGPDNFMRLYVNKVLRDTGTQTGSTLPPAGSNITHKAATTVFGYGGGFFGKTLTAGELVALTDAVDSLNSSLGRI